MRVKELIQLMLELDDQVLHPRPSPWLVAAQLLHDLASHSEGSLRRGNGPDIYGDGWESVNVSSDRPVGDREGWE